MKQVPTLPRVSIGSAPLEQHLSGVLEIVLRDRRFSCKLPNSCEFSSQRQRGRVVSDAQEHTARSMLGAFTQHAAHRRCRTATALHAFLPRAPCPRHSWHNAHCPCSSTTQLTLPTTGQRGRDMHRLHAPAACTPTVAGYVLTRSPACLPATSAPHPLWVIMQTTVERRTHTTRAPARGVSDRRTAGPLDRPHRYVHEHEATGAWSPGACRARGGGCSPPCAGGGACGCPAAGRGVAASGSPRTGGCTGRAAGWACSG